MPTDDVIEDSRFGLIDLDDPPPRAPVPDTQPAAPAPPPPPATSAPGEAREGDLAPGLEAFRRRRDERRPRASRSGGARRGQSAAPSGLVSVGLRLQHTDPGELEVIRLALLEMFPGSSIYAPQQGRNPRYRDTPPTWFLRGSLVMVLRVLGEEGA